MTFATNSALEVHASTHTGERPYACGHEGCGKRFSESGSITAHKRTHTGDQPFACDHEGCGMRFSTSGSLTRHKKRAHTSPLLSVPCWVPC